jgi:hypothetical protein
MLPDLFDQPHSALPIYEGMHDIFAHYPQIVIDVIGTIRTNELIQYIYRRDVNLQLQFPFNIRATTNLHVPCADYISFIVYHHHLPIPRGFLPLNLYALKITSDIPCPFHLPQNLELFIVDDKFNSKLSILPQKLDSLFLNGSYNKPIDKLVLPFNLRILVTGKKFNHPILHDILPKNLHTLVLGDSYNYSIDANILPPHLHTLIIGSGYHQKLVIGSLPSSLKIFSIGNNFTYSLDSILPDSIEILLLGNNVKRLNTIPKSTVYIYAPNQECYDQLTLLNDGICFIENEYRTIPEICQLMNHFRIVVADRKRRKRNMKNKTLK